MRAEKKGIRVGIDARLKDGELGGVQQFIIGMASGLSGLNDGNEEYLFLTYLNNDQWLQPYINGPCKILPSLQPPKNHRLKELLTSKSLIIRITSQKLKSLVDRWMSKQWMLNIAKSDGNIEKSSIDVMHFTKQDGFLTNIDSIYHPWDLQHLHFPQFFTPRNYALREVLYRKLCTQARMVAVASHWGKHDLIKHYGLPEEKICVIPVAPVLTFYPKPSKNDLARVKLKYSLPESFVFYPAQTWEHKNHRGLLEALAILRDRDGLTVPLVSSGYINTFFEEIKDQAEKSGLSSQIQFLGFISPLDLQCLYKLCQCLVFPSKFEGGGLPIIEAFQAGVPTACSNVTCLPEQAGDAALIFDPNKPTQIADAIRRLWTDGELCKDLVVRGYKRVSNLTWDRTARIFRAHYRRIAKSSLTDEDRAYLNDPS